MRFVIFAAVGPPVGVTLLHLAAAAAMGWASIERVMLGFAGGIFLGYLMGLVPLLLTAVLDWWLERRGTRYRAAWCAVFGGLACWQVGREFTNAPWHFLALAGMAGAISAALCSWLAAMNKQKGWM